VAEIWARGRLLWRIGEVVETQPETPRTRSLFLKVPNWEGHKAGQHVDVRLTAEDGYQAQRSYSIASAPEDRRLTLAVERLEDGEVSPYLTDVLRAGDGLELRGPIGGWFTGRQGKEDRSSSWPGGPASRRSWPWYDTVPLHRATPRADSSTPRVRVKTRSTPRS
jgi:hypothetical protein